MVGGALGVAHVVLIAAQSLALRIIAPMFHLGAHVRGSRVRLIHLDYKPVTWDTCPLAWVACPFTWGKLSVALDTSFVQAECLWSVRVCLPETHPLIFVPVAIRLEFSGEMTPDH